jgi:hypothetical protein
MSQVRIPLALVVLALICSCNLNKITTDSTAPVLANGSVALDRESDLQFAREALPASLKTLETFLINSPDNPDLLLLLAKGFNSYAYGFVEADLEKARLSGSQDEVDRLSRRAVLHYLRARTYGFTLLDFPELEDAALNGDLDKAARLVKDLEKDDAPALFWTTQAWGAAVSLAQDDPDMVASLPMIELFLNRLLKLNPNYFAGSPMALAGTYHASRPAMFGGNPDKAKESFEKGMKAHGDRNLLIPYLYARFYATQVQDRALFNELMVKVLEADVTQYPDLRLQNEIARERARFWVENSQELFFE